VRERADEALRQAVATLGGSFGALHLTDPDRAGLRLAAWHGDGPEGTPESVAQVAWSPDAAAPAEGLPGAWVAPVRMGDHLIGSLAVGPRAGAPDMAEGEAMEREAARIARRLAPPAAEALWAELSARVPAERLAWLDAQVEAAAAGDLAAVRRAFPAVGRRLGRGPFGSAGALVREDGDAAVPLRAWRMDDAGRVAMLLAVPEDREELARELYYSGDMRERTGVLRGLAVFGRDETALDALRDAYRANARELFEAAVADSPYASTRLTDDEFRQVALKAIFLGVSLECIALIHERADAELTGSLIAYVTEREMAVRSVPPDIWPVAGSAPVPGVVARLVGYLEHPMPAHRAGAARGLGLSGDSRARSFLEERLAREADPSVRAAIERALAL